MKYLLAIAALLPVTLQAAEPDETQFGVALGTPGGVNLVMKKEIAGHPIQLAVGYTGKAYGIEAGYSFYYNRDSAMRSWQVIAGSSTIKDNALTYYSTQDVVYRVYEDEDWNYAGVSGTFQYGGFYIEPGITVGSGDFSSPQLTIQVGWLW